MPRLCARAIAFTAMIICLPVIAQAADTRLMLTCQGTRTYKTYQPDQKGEPNAISIGVIVNLTEGTVTGLDDEPPLKIQNVTGTAITFGMHWSSNDGQTVKGTLGKLDRLTGDMEVTRNFTQDAHKSTSVWSWLLKCKPAQRMFDNGRLR